MTARCRYAFRYTTEATFRPAVERHFFKLRAMPMECAFQHVVEAGLTVDPPCGVTYSKDGFGNDVQWGGYDSAHAYFRVECHGIVECLRYAIPDACPGGMYLMPSALTEPSDGIRRMAGAGCAEGIMHAVHGHIGYARFATGNMTTAAEVYDKGRGVCQDYAHLMIAACRAAGLPARYVNGLMLGEGETHAWVEVHDGRQWQGFDPTHDRRIGWGYVKLAHGRDVGDCPSNRGRFYGLTGEVLRVGCDVKEIPCGGQPDGKGETISGLTVRQS